jgi:3,4-dihydroxy-2-butanone 4-phosphate synthase
MSSRVSVICVPIANERAERLGRQRMVAQNREMYRTDFTVSVGWTKSSGVDFGFAIV